MATCVPLQEVRGSVVWVPDPSLSAGSGVRLIHTYTEEEAKEQTQFPSLAFPLLLPSNPSFLPLISQFFSLIESQYIWRWFQNLLVDLALD